MKSNSVKSTLPRMAVAMVIGLIVLILPVNIVLQLYMQHNSQRESSQEVFAQLRQLIMMNVADLQQARDEFSDQCIQAAEMAAYFVEHDDTPTWDLKHAQELAEKLDVDELHFFTPEGVIYFGSHPQYYGLNFNSGEQMQFFLPMLTDRSLKMCQEITPNTAEGKAMQYAAVWLCDGSGIVQIGMEPRRLMEEMEKRDLAGLLSSMPMDLRGYLHILDMDTMTIVASTAENMVGLNVQDQIDDNVELAQQDSFHSEYNGKHFCVYTQQHGGYLFVRTYNSSYPIERMITSSVMMLIYILLVAGLIIGLITWYVDRNLSGNLMKIVENLRAIEDGRMETLKMKTNISEFDELIFYINQMINSIQLSWNKLSYIIDKGHLPIGIFEYNTFYKKAFFNGQLLNVLGIEEDPNIVYHEQMALLIWERLVQIQQQPAGTEQGIYTYDKHQDGQPKYYRIDKVEDNQSVTFYVTDVSLWWSEIHQLREQSNRDSLTGLFNRRGFSEQMEELFVQPLQIGNSMMIIIDADKLKRINDVYGHYVGDEYLVSIASALKQAAGEQAVCARLGGDEFAIFLHHCASAQEAEQILNRIYSVRGSGFVSEQCSFSGKLEFSLGYAVYPIDGMDYHLLMHIADENMYREKRERQSR